jgi:hypothetical protein
MGLKEVFEPKKEEPAVVIQVSGEPPDELPVEAQVAQVRPADSVVLIRPWLLDEPLGDKTSGERAAPPDDSTR